MRIVYHLGAHCTDQERLIRCLLKNRDTLARQGIAVPGPARYRALLRDTAIQLRGAPASRDTQAMLLEQIAPDSSAERVVLSWDSFIGFAKGAVRGGLYPAAAERMRAFVQIFPDFETEFHLAIRNPATFVPALVARQRGRPGDEAVTDTDPTRLSWSAMVGALRAANPEVPVTVWCDEDTPLIWPEVLAAVSGCRPGTPFSDGDELLAEIMTPEGLAALRGALAAAPPADSAVWRRMVADHLARFARPEALETEIDLPGWDADLVAWLNAAYDRDVARLRDMPGVTLLWP
jgi:hypothetical protein